MNTQDLINIATVSEEQKLVDKTIEQFDFKQYFIVEKRPNVLLLVMIKQSTSLQSRETIENLAAQKLTSLGYTFEKIGIGGFLIQNPIKE